MPDLFQPQEWNDGPTGGTPMTASRGPRRWESGIDAVDAALDALADRVDSQSGNSGSGDVIVDTGTTADRGTPTLGRLFYDTTINALVVGTGSAWVTPSGTAPAGGGSSTAPTNMTGTVNSDSSISLSWSGSYDHYKLYETRSPSGVTGADAITTTSTTRTPGGTGQYDYWVTGVTAAGVESAASNKATVYLPYGASSSGGGTTTGGTGSPGAILNIGTSNHFNVGIGLPSGHTDYSESQIKGGFTSSPYFIVNSAGDGVQFRAPMNGGTTSANTKYPRSELRELQSDGSTKAAWSGSSGTHVMSGTTKITHFAPNKQEVVVAQAHDASDDTCQIFCTPTTWSVKINGASAGSTKSVSINTWTDWSIRCASGKVTVTVGGTALYSGSPGWASGQYFKAGMYPQQNVKDSGNSSSEYASCELKNLVVTHS